MTVNMLADRASDLHQKDIHHGRDKMCVNPQTRPHTNRLKEVKHCFKYSDISPFVVLL